MYQFEFSLSRKQSCRTQCSSSCIRIDEEFTRRKSEKERRESGSRKQRGNRDKITDSTLFDFTLGLIQALHGDLLYETVAFSYATVYLGPTFAREQTNQLAFKNQICLFRLTTVRHLLAWSPCRLGTVHPPCLLDWFPRIIAALFVIHRHQSPLQKLTPSQRAFPD